MLSPIPSSHFITNQTGPDERFRKPLKRRQGCLLKDISRFFHKTPPQAPPIELKKLPPLMKPGPNLSLFYGDVWNLAAPRQGDGLLAFLPQGHICFSHEALLLDKRNLFTSEQKDGILIQGKAFEARDENWPDALLGELFPLVGNSIPRLEQLSAFINGWPINEIIRHMNTQIQEKSLDGWFPLIVSDEGKTTWTITQNDSNKLRLVQNHSGFIRGFQASKGSAKLLETPTPFEVSLTMLFDVTEPHLQGAAYAQMDIKLPDEVKNSFYEDIPL